MLGAPEAGAVPGPWDDVDLGGWDELAARSCGSRPDQRAVLFGQDEAGRVDRAQLAAPCQERTLHAKPP